MVRSTVSGESSRWFVTPQLFDRIIGSERALLAIETERADELLAQFRQYAVRSGSSIYAWNEDKGIVSLREGQLCVPGSARLPEALRYVQSSPQFGLYLFPNLDDQLRGSTQRVQIIGLLRQFARGRSTPGGVRRIVLLGPRLDLDDTLEALVERIADVPESGRNLRLRDGRWVT
jgi:hypothetical protein